MPCLAKMANVVVVFDGFQILFKFFLTYLDKRSFSLDETIPVVHYFTPQTPQVICIWNHVKHQVMHKFLSIYPHLRPLRKSDFQKECNSQCKTLPHIGLWYWQWDNWPFTKSDFKDRFCIMKEKLQGFCTDLYFSWFFHCSFIFQYSITIKLISIISGNLWLFL